jgi:two-component system, chemotaxis family, chemotaxis protein CheY
MRILIVDDSRAMRLIVARTLRLAGYEEHELIEAVDGRHALDVVAEEPPDLVLCDWNMPQMSGLELLTALRSAGSSIPFGFVTSEASPQMRVTARQAGAMFLIAKPFTAQDFQDALDPVLA